MREVEGPPGAPWHRRLHGTLHELTVESEVLRGNPLGDPHVRPLYVYEPVEAGDDAPAVFLLQAFGKQADMWFTRKLFEPTLIEALDDAFTRGEIPRAYVVLPDAWTSLGGSQYINSTGTGRYMDYLCDEIVPFVVERFGAGSGAVGRAVAGHSSGGYGALVTAMLRPDTFSAVGAIAPDTLFDVSLLSDVGTVVRTLRDGYDGSFAALFERLRETGRVAGDMHLPLSLYAYAAAYSPAPSGTGVLFPFDLATGELDHDVFERWLRWDPVRMAAHHVDALKSLRRLHVEAGRRDEFHLDLGATALHNELDRLGVGHGFELFEGGHGGATYRLPPLIAGLLEALS